MALAVGLAGAGPWAGQVHAPVLAAGPETRLAGVWNRTPDAARALAARFGVPAFDRYDDLLDACEAVAIAVAPDAQPDLAVAAARRGKALLLEKPLAADLAGARRVAAEVAEAGVPSVVVFSYRFSAGVRSFLAAVPGVSPVGGRGSFLSGAFLGGPFSLSPWRQQRGALLDVGPHLVDLLDAALGPVVSVRAHAGPGGWVGLLLDHEGGATSEASLCCRVAVEPSRTVVEVLGPGGGLELDARAVTGPEVFEVVRAEFAAAAAGGSPHPLDAAHALRIAVVLDEAERQLQRA